MMKQPSISRRERGFTLVEIAIVLMIVGLLIGGILRGQELIQSARVRNLIDQKSAIQTAYIGFLDRYRMQAGDLLPTQVGVVGNNALSSANGGDGSLLIASESTLFFQNLAAAGFISCNACLTVALTPGGAGPAPSTTNSPLNVYGNFLSAGHMYSSNTGAAASTWLDPTAGIVRLVVMTGGTVPTQVLAEMDRKADDGMPGTGQLRFTPGAATTTSVAGYCVPNLAGGVVAASWANPSQGDCQGAWLF